MTGKEVRTERRQRGWKQAELAKRLGVSQGYVSLLERGRRTVPPPLATKLVSLLELRPSRLPVRDAKPLLPAHVVGALGRLGYPGFAYARESRLTNPSELVVGTLLRGNVEPRVVEALPWLLVKYPDLNWEWVVRQAKQHDLQNRLGFVVSLARELAAKGGDQRAATTFLKWERVLEHSRLQREDSFSPETLTNAERRWLQTNRSAEGLRWNLLTNMSADQLTNV
jgi:transcriptional regulator with XRE-family HTH domain